MTELPDRKIAQMPFSFLRLLFMVCPFICESWSFAFQLLIRFSNQLFMLIWWIFSFSRFLFSRFYLRFSFCVFGGSLLLLPIVTIFRVWFITVRAHDSIFIALQFCCHWHILIRHVYAVLYGTQSRIYPFKILFICWILWIDKHRYPLFFFSVCCFLKINE